MFELSDELVRQIIFAMENQNNVYLMDTELGVLVRIDGLPPEEVPDTAAPVLEIQRRYQPLPDWTSADGFQLMERFLGELHNPVARNSLQEILLSGKRVFRRFKDTVREYPEVEKRYFRFKFVEMRRVVGEWYARLRELAGLDAQEVGADQELDDLVLTEITISPLESPLQNPSASEIEALDYRACLEAWTDLPEDLREHLYAHRRARELGSPDSPGMILYGARNPLEELCGLLWARRVPLGGNGPAPPPGAASPLGSPSEVASPARAALVEIHQIFVYPEYRGLGVATSLLEKLLQDTGEEGVQYVISRLPGTQSSLGALMRAMEFQDLGRICIAPRLATRKNQPASDSHPWL